MFEHKKLDELHKLYRILKRDEATLGYVLRIMSPYIEDRGSKIVED